MDINYIPLEARAEYHGTVYVKVKRIERKQVLRRSFAFEIFDAKGREIGHSYAIDREYHIIDADSHTIVSAADADDTLDETFVVYPHGLRDGVEFGATPVASRKRFKDLGDAIRYADKTVERARKAADKKAAK